MGDLREREGESALTCSPSPYRPEPHPWTYTQHVNFRLYHPRLRGAREQQGRIIIEAPEQLTPGKKAALLQYYGLLKG